MEFPCSSKKSVKKKVKPKHPNQKGKNRNLKEYLILRHMHQQSASIDPLKTRSPESDRYGINGLHTGSKLHPNFFRSIAHYTSLYVSSFRTRSVGLNILTQARSAWVGDKHGWVKSLANYSVVSRAMLPDGNVEQSAIYLDVHFA